MSAAAAELQVPQPTLSQQIKRLETRVGFQMFIRDGRGLHLTDAGEAFRNRIAPLPLQIRDAIAASQAAATSETLHIGLCPGVTYSRIADLTERLRASYDQAVAAGDRAQMQLHSTSVTEVATALKHGRVAMSIVRWPFAHRDLDATVFRSDPLGVIVHRTHPLAQHDTVSWRDLDGHGLLCPDPAQSWLDPGSLLSEVHQRRWTPQAVTVLDDHNPAVITHVLAGRSSVMLSAQDDLPASRELRWLPLRRDPILESLALVSLRSSLYARLALSSATGSDPETVAATG